jgi:MSHA biogenesis protein MshE
MRRLCKSCAEDDRPDIYESTWLRDRLTVEADKFHYRRGKGCLHCGFTGYRGRIGVYELLEMNAQLAEALRREDTQEFIEAAQRAPGYRPLIEEAHRYAVEGLTTLDEVLRLAGQSREELIGEPPLDLELEQDD